jgi:hypothetical protein
MDTPTVDIRLSDRTASGDPVPSRLAALPTERLEAELCGLAAAIAVATCRFLEMVAEYGRRRAYEQWECHSMAHWLVAQVGVSRVTAREYVRVAEALERYPIMREAFAAGRLSYSRVRALARVITATTESDLVEMALLMSAPQLERFAAGVARAQAADRPDAAEALAEARGLSLCHLDDGSWELRGRLEPEVGALLDGLLRAALADSAPPERGAQPGVPQPTYAQRQADAFAHVLERRSLDPDAAPAEPLVVLHRYPDGDELCDRPVPRSTADAIACAGRTVAVQHRPDNGSRAHRRFPSRIQRRAARDRDVSCRFPGCGVRRDLHVHHIRPVAARGPTVVDNLVMLCPTHHRALHRRGWQISGDPAGELRFTRVAEERTFDSEALDGIIDIEAVVEGFEALAWVSGPVGAGHPERLDLHLAVQAHLHNESIRAAWPAGPGGVPPV